MTVSAAVLPHPPAVSLSSASPTMESAAVLPHPAAIPAEPVGLPEFLVRFQQVPVFRRPDRRSYWVPIHIHTLHSTSYIFSHIILSTQGNHRIYYITLHSVILPKKQDGAPSRSPFLTALYFTKPVTNLNSATPLLILTITRIRPNSPMMSPAIASPLPDL